MYVTDARFADSYERYAPGLADYVQAVFAANAEA
jgi:hypothetical protein